MERHLVMEKFSCPTSFFAYMQLSMPQCQAMLRSVLAELLVDEEMKCSDEGVSHAFSHSISHVPNSNPAQVGIYACSWFFLVFQTSHNVFYVNVRLMHTPTQDMRKGSDLEFSLPSLPAGSSGNIAPFLGSLPSPSVAFIHGFLEAARDGGRMGDLTFTAQPLTDKPGPSVPQEDIMGEVFPGEPGYSHFPPYQWAEQRNMTGHTLSPDCLGKLFPYHIMVSQEGNILQVRP